MSSPTPDPRELIEQCAHALYMSSPERTDEWDGVAAVVAQVVLRWAAEQWHSRAKQVAEQPVANLGQSWHRYELSESYTGVAEWHRAQAMAIEAGAPWCTEAARVARDALIRADERRKIDKEIRRYAAECSKPGLALIIEGVAAQHPAAEGICESCGDPVVYNLAIGYVAHKDADESVTCTEPYPSIPTADVIAAAERRGYGPDGVTPEGGSDV